MSRLAPILALASACAGPAETHETGAPSEPILPSAYEPADAGTDTASAPAALDLAALKAWTDEIIVSLRQDDSGEVLAAYAAALRWADASCPAFTVSGEGTSGWSDDCTTADGATFYGNGFTVDDSSVDASGGVLSRDELFPQCRITSPSGQHFYGSGYAARNQLLQSDGVTLFLATLYGYYSSDADEDAEGWLAEQVENDTSLVLTASAGGLATRARVSGTLAGFDGAFSAISFNDLEIGSQYHGWPCPGEPTGTLSIRGSDGAWLSLSFDLQTGEGSQAVDPARCDGCGTLSDADGELGELCVDFLPLLDWEERPW